MRGSTTTWSHTGPRLAAAGLEQVAGTAETAVYDGGSPWAAYWTQTVVELRDRLVDSGRLDDRLIDRFLAQCDDPSWWTQTIAFTAVHARATGAERRHRKRGRIASGLARATRDQLDDPPDERDAVVEPEPPFAPRSPLLRPVLSSSDCAPPSLARPRP